MKKIVDHLPILAVREAANGFSELLIVGSTGVVLVASDMMYGEAMRRANVLLKTGMFSHVQEAETEEEAR